MSVRLATGPVCWGVDFADDPGNPPWDAVLDEIQRSGFRWTELGPLGYLPEDPGVLRAELRRRELEVAGSFVFEALDDRVRRSEVLDIARRTCRMIGSVGGRFLVMIDRARPGRVATAGRSADAERLDRAQRQALIDGVLAVAELAREEFGLHPVLHPHVGTAVEFEDEIEDMLEALDPSLVGLCLDTGHCAYAAIDPIALYERHSGRVPYLHLKDVDAAAYARVMQERLDFWQAIGVGVFCALGQGLVDFGGLARALSRTGFDGWATVEQDRDPARGDALSEAIESRLFLEGLGLGAGVGQPATKASTR